MPPLAGAQAPQSWTGGAGAPSSRANRSGPSSCEQLEQPPRVVVPRLDVGRVLGIAVDAPGADRDDRREASRDEIAEHDELIRLERRARCVAVDGDARGPEHVVARPAAHQGGDRDGQVGERRAVWQMSPKSTIPEMRSSSSSSTLSRLKSPWTTCAGRCGQSGATRSSYRSSTASTMRRRSTSAIAPGRAGAAARHARDPRGARAPLQDGRSRAARARAAHASRRSRARRRPRAPGRRGGHADARRGARNACRRAP